MRIGISVGIELTALGLAMATVAPLALAGDASLAIEGCCWQQKNVPSKSPNNGSGSSGWGAASDALNNYNQQLMENGRRREAQQLQEQQNSYQQDQAAKRRNQEEENRRLAEENEAWRRKEAGDEQKKDSDKNKTVEADTTKGCPFLMYPKYGFTHNPGDEFCWQEHRTVCEVVKRDGGVQYYGWRKTVTSCTGLVSPKVIEYNRNSAHETNVNFFD